MTGHRRMLEPRFEKGMLDHPSPVTSCRRTAIRSRGVDIGDRRRLAVVEVKVDANHAWYAAVENLRQVKLVLESPVRALFAQRRPDLTLPENLPVAAIVLAPPDFYAHRGQKANAAGPACELFDSVQQKLGIKAHLVTFDAAVGSTFGL
jgi:hypothetical protein